LTTPEVAWRHLAQAHEHPRLIALAETSGGRVAVWLLAAGLLSWQTRVLFAFLPVLALVQLFPRLRRPWLALAAVAVALNALRVKLGLPLTVQTFLSASWIPTAVAAGLLFGLCWAVFVAAVEFRTLPEWFRRRPQIVLHTGVWIAIVCVWAFPGATLFHAVVAALPLLVWRLGYLLTAGRRGSVIGTRFHDHLLYLFPVWGGRVPYGKGHEYLTRHEDHGPAALAASQLAGLKLLVLAALWTGARLLVDGVVYGSPSSPVGPWLGGGVWDLPTLPELVAGERAVPLPVAWLALFVALVDRTLWIAVYGHVVVGCLRLCGFNVFRNTYKPLLSESIVEFWGRFHYYFKELLVDFFFYPTYLKRFKARPTLRMFAAVGAAALVGNMYFHLLASKLLMRADFSAVWTAYGPRTVYCALLAMGVAVSMLRQQRVRARGETPVWPVRLRRIAGVWLFFGVIQIWIPYAPKPGFGPRLTLMLSLLGL
jgi:hypothetical protein